VAAWQHVVSIFRSASATNVTWVWAPNCGPTATISSYYPGDSWVDVIGLDGYNWGSSLGKWQSFSEVFGSSYDIVSALSATKPVMITETASAEAGGDKAAWITSAYQTEIPTRFPRVTAVIWFNVDKEADWRVESSSAAIGAYQSVVASSAWGGGSTSTTTATLAVPSLSVSSYGRTSVSLVWQTVPEATGYTVQAAADSSFSSPRDVAATGTAVTISGLKSATRYWFRIRATNGSAVSAWSLPVAVTTSGKKRK
jgi:Fibronectin type III domain/Glycosyl hydrolase family 26